MQQPFLVEVDDLNALRDALRIISGKNIFICKSGKSADFPDLLFHGEGVVAENCLSTVAFFLMKKGEDATRSAALSQKARCKCCLPQRPLL